MIRKLLLVGLLLVGGGIATASDDVGTDIQTASSPDPATSTAASPSPTATPDVPPDSDPGVILKEFPQSGPRNQVRLENKHDGRFLARAAISLHRSNPQKVQPMNIAIAESRCVNCATMAFAVQVFLYQSSDYVQPVNLAIVVNNNCDGCASFAWAIQYVIPVDDLTTTPENVRTLLREMESELRYFASVNSVNELDIAQVEARLASFFRRHATLEGYLGIERARTQGAAPSPSADPASPSPTPAPASAEPTPAPTAAPSASEAPSPTPSPP